MEKIVELTPFWKWDSELPKGLTDLAIAESDLMKKQSAKIGLQDGELNLDIRNSKVVLANPVNWVCGILFNYARVANMEAGWNRILSHPETVQFTEYSEGEFYDFHSDTDFLTNASYVRKLTAVCLLNDESEFEGGDFEFLTYGKVELTRGTILVFPSLLTHRVTPVTKGIRKTAVMWGLGPAQW